MIGGYSKLAHKFPLHKYQDYAAEWMLYRMYADQQKGAGLFLDPGLGKTRITLSVVDQMIQLGGIKRALVVAPLRPVYGVWPTQLKDWGFPQSHVVLHNQMVRALPLNRQIEIVNYGHLQKIKDIEKRWDLIVLDESTYFKNWSRKRSVAVRKLCRTIPKRVILTGTPAANHLGDLHSQIFTLDDGAALGKTAGAFRKRFMYQGGWRGRKWLMRENMADELSEAIQHLVLCMKAEDYLDMPDLLENNIWVKMPNSAYKEYGRLKRELFAQLESGEVFAATAAAAYTKCRQFANGQVYSTDEETGIRTSHAAHNEKLAAMRDLVDELGGKPLLVFYFFEQDVDRIRENCGQVFKTAPVIAGSKKYKMKPAEFERTQKKWNNGEFRVMLCQWNAASHGLNLQGACNDVCCFGVVDSLETYEQAYRRVYRQGVKGGHVRIHRILTQGTLDEVMIERLAGKHKTQSEFMNALKKHAKG
jgi:hypothetical protein